MGSTSSKAARKLPKTPPSWAGTRTPHPDFAAQGRDAEAGATRAERNPHHTASETRTHAINMDAKDPQLLANLGRLGPVKVHQQPMLSIKNKVEETNRLFQSRVQSELEASSHQLAPGHLHAATLVHLLDKRKGVNSMGELDELARKWNLEGAKKLENVAKYVNSPSVQGNKVIRMVGKDGEEILILSAVWAEPRFLVPQIQK